MNTDKILELTVSDGQDMRLDRWLRKRYDGLQQGVIEKALRQGKIRLDGQKVQANTRLNNGQIILFPKFLLDIKPQENYSAPESQVSEQDLEDLESCIIWEDDDLLILNKPHGIAVQGGSKTKRHMDGFLQALGAKKNVKYRLVHRLDRDTSGVFVVAKTAEMAAHLTAGFREGSYQKTYWAVVCGFAQPAQGTIDLALTKGGPQNKEKVFVDEKYGKKAVTTYRTLKKLIDKRLPELTLLELTPETGRTHQLRVHCAYCEFPILGDGKYGGKEATEYHRDLHLHARSIVIRDRDGNKLKFVAPPSLHMEETLYRYKIEWNQF